MNEIKLSDGTYLHIQGEVYISTHGVLTIKQGTKAVAAYAHGTWEHAERMDVKIVAYGKKKWWKL